MPSKNATREQAAEPAPVDRMPSVDQATLDRVNLEHALRDFETANARVIDLTARLTTLHERHLDLQHEASLLRIELANRPDLGHVVAERDAARAECDALRRSTSYRLGNKVVRLVKRLMP